MDIGEKFALPEKKTNKILEEKNSLPFTLPQSLVKNFLVLLIFPPDLGSRLHIWVIGNAKLCCRRPIQLQNRVIAIQLPRAFF